MYLSWLGEAHGSITPEKLGEDVDGLMTMTVVLHCLRARLPQLPGKLNELLCPNQGCTTAGRGEHLRSKTPVMDGICTLQPTRALAIRDEHLISWREGCGADQSVKQLELRQNRRVRVKRGDMP